jgi:2-iminoacetate synthase ThiH
MRLSSLFATYFHKLSHWQNIWIKSWQNNHIKFWQNNYIKSWQKYLDKILAKYLDTILAGEAEKKSFNYRNDIAKNDAVCAVSAFPDQ